MLTAPYADAFISVSGLFSSPTGGYCGVLQDGTTRKTNDAAKFARLLVFVPWLNLFSITEKQAESMNQKTAAIRVAAC
jgi:hypothetical protein